jgi:beta-barrel assembly-enhancing protease
MKNPVFGAVATLSLLASSSASFGEPIPVVPPYEGVYQPQGIDEIGLWKVDDEYERKLRDSSVVIRDEALNAYLKGVLCSAIGADRCDSVRLYVIKEPVFQATMSPNGTMRIFTGLLLRCRNEAELAAVLGHEFGHFEKRHALNAFKKNRTTSDVLSWAYVLAATASTYQSRSTYNDLRYSVYGDLHRYNRDQEREADRLGITYLNGSQLRPQAASKVWINLMAEITVSSQMKGYGKPRFDSIAYTASHPPEMERAATLAALALPEGNTREDGHDRYKAAIKPWLAEFLADQIKLNDFGASEYILNSLAEDGWTDTLWYARGELFRLRGNPRDHVNAANFYREAITLNPNMADAYKGMGLSLMKNGQRAEALDALSHYLKLKPEAQDAEMIRMLLPSPTQEPKS